MKKYISLLLCLVLTISLFGCTTPEVEEDGAEAVIMPENQQPDPLPIQKPDTSDKTDTKPPKTEQKPEQKPDSTPVPEQSPQNQQTPNPQSTLPDYKSFKCESVSAWKEVRFEGEDGVIVFVDIPSDWTLTKKDDSTYNITRGGAQAGVITTISPKVAKKTLELDATTIGERQISVKTQVNWYEGQDSVQRVITVSSKQKTGTFGFYIDIDYKMLDSASLSHLVNSCGSVPLVTNNLLRKVSESNGAKQILIVGNSFVGTSNIGTFINSMLKKEGFSATAISRGHATTQTYANDLQVLTDIQNGKYAYVFVCGFYGDSANIDALGTILERANMSDTEVAIFPAHNESSSNYMMAATEFETVKLINWQSELQSLIDSGVVTYSDLRENDSYGHSKALAGYIGAHMIYRNMFKKIPPEISGCPIDMSFVRSKLRDYPDSLHESEPVIDNYKGVVYKIS